MSQQLVERLARPELLSMQGYSSARMEAGAAPVILNANENPWAPECGCRPDWEINRYPAPQPDDVIKRLAELYRVNREHILVTRGSDEGIDLLIRAFCRAGIDSITYCPPTFGMYAVSAAIQNAAKIAIPLDADNNWQLDTRAITRAQSKLVFLCSPNNPTGHVLNTNEVIALCNHLTDQALIVVDEAYIEFAGTDSLASQLDACPNLVILRTLSKAWGMAGLRCGSVLASPAIIGLLRKIMAPYPLPVTTQRVVSEALSDANSALMRQRVKQLLEQRELMAEQLSGLCMIENIWPSQANFLLLKVSDAAGLTAAAAIAGILIRNQSAQPGLKNCIRISIGTAEENTALLNFLNTYQEPL